MEGELINQIQNMGDTSDGIILNAAAFTHTSVGIADAVKSIKSKVIEVHISNTFSRESFRHKSFLSPVVDGIIVGFVNGFITLRFGIPSFIATLGMLYIARSLTTVATAGFPPPFPHIFFILKKTRLYLKSLVKIFI